MMKIYVISVFCALALLQATCLGEEEKVSPDNFITINTDEFAQSSEIPEETQVPSGEETGDYSNTCSLTSSEVGRKAVFQCQDGTIWEVIVQQKDDSCILDSSITYPSGEATISEVTITCAEGQDLIQELVDAKEISGIPEDFWNGKDDDYESDYEEDTPEQ